MLLKSADDKTAQLQELTLLLEHPDVPADTRPKIQKQLHALRRGIQGEQESAYEIDFHFKGNSQWVVMHDLRFEHQGRVAQIDHVLISRFLDVFVLESKNYAASVDINAMGEFSARYASGFSTGIKSPLRQNEQHIAVLRELWHSLPLPLPPGLAPHFYNVVLFHPKAIINRPPDGGFVDVIKADALQDWIDAAINRTLQTGAGRKPHLASVEQLLAAAAMLQAQHRPLTPNYRARFDLSPQLAPRNAREAALQTMDQISDKARRNAGLPPDDSRVACHDCQVALSTAVIAYCRSHGERFKQRLLCMSCQPAYAVVAEGAAPPPAAKADKPAPAGKSAKPAKPQRCAACGAEVDAKVAAFCRFNKPRFGGKLLCRDCQPPPA